MKKCLSAICKLYQKAKPTNPLCLHHRCDIQMDLHAPATPQKKLVDLCVSNDREDPLLDVALIVFAVCGIMTLGKILWDR